MEIKKKHSLALLLDPEKANLDALPISESCHPDYIFVGGSTGGDTTDFVRALKSKIKNHKSPSSSSPVIRHNLPRKQIAYFSSRYSPEITRNTL